MQIVFFHGAYLGSAENGSGENASQWTGSDNRLERLWHAKYRFCSCLQSNVARLAAENRC